MRNIVVFIILVKFSLFAEPNLFTSESFRINKNYLENIAESLSENDVVCINNYNNRYKLGLASLMVMYQKTENTLKNNPSELKVFKGQIRRYLDSEINKWYDKNRNPPNSSKLVDHKFTEFVNNQKKGAFIDEIDYYYKVAMDHFVLTGNYNPLRTLLKMDYINTIDVKGLINRFNNHPESRCAIINFCLEVDLISRKKQGRTFYGTHIIYAYVFSGVNWKQPEYSLGKIKSNSILGRVVESLTIDYILVFNSADLLESLAKYNSTFGFYLPLKTSPLINTYLSKRLETAKSQIESIFKDKTSRSSRSTNKSLRLKDATERRN